MEGKILIIEDNKTKLERLKNFCAAHYSDMDKPLAGVSILRYMLLAGIDTKVVVVTMYENFVDGVKIKQLDRNFKAQYPDIYEGYVYYSHKNSDWKKALKTIMDRVL